MLAIGNDGVYGAAGDRERILEGVKKEGRLVLYTGMDTDEANLYAKEFTKHYPFIKPEIFRSSGEKVQTRFLVEHRANVHNADIFQTSIVQVYQLKNAGLLTKYVSEESRVYAESFKDSQGCCCKIIISTPPESPTPAREKTYARQAVPPIWTPPTGASH